MPFLILKALISGIMVLVIAETSKRSPTLGGLIASLPLVSVLAMIWLWQDTGDTERLANHASATFWYVLPSLPMFLILPFMMRHGIGFWLALGICCGITMALYSLMVWLLRLWGISL